MKVDEIKISRRFSIHIFLFGCLLVGPCLSYAGSISVDESDVREDGQYWGPQPYMIVAFADSLSNAEANEKGLPVGTWDILPPGPDSEPGGSYWVFALFDTGSESVTVTSVTASWLSMDLPKYVGLMRANGIGTLLPDNTAPIGRGYAKTSGSTYRQHIFGTPQIDLGGMILGASTIDDYLIGAPFTNSAIVAKGENLIGAPFINTVIALIDYRVTSRVERGPFDFLYDCPNTFEDERIVSSPAVTFYSPFHFWGTNSIKKIDEVVMRLERFGNFSLTPEGVRKGPRYYLRNVDLLHKGAIVNDIIDNYDYLYDSNSAYTVISTEVADELDLPDNSSSDFRCKIVSDVQTTDNRCNPELEIRELPGFILDEVVMNGTDGSEYTVKNARVCVDSEMVEYDAILGSNLFDQVQLLFNGHSDRLTVVTDLKRGDLNTDGHVDCTDFDILRAEIGRPTQNVRIDGYSQIAYSQDFGNFLRTEYTADEIVKVDSISYDFTGTLVFRDFDGEDFSGDETQVFTFTNDNAHIVDLDKFPSAGTPLRSDFYGGKVSIQLNDGTTIEAIFNETDSEALAQEFFGAAARFTVQIPEYRIPSDPAFDLNEDGEVDFTDVDTLYRMFEDPDNVPCAYEEVKPGDIDGDGRVATSEDVTAFRAAYGTQNNDVSFNPNADLDGNGRINISPVKFYCHRIACITDPTPFVLD